MSRLLYPRIWILSRQYPITQVAKQLKNVVGIEPGGHQQLRTLFLDTFDWRIYRKGWVLQASQDEDKWQLKLFKLTSGKILARSPVDAIPEFTEDIPAGILAEKLYKRVFPRALYPICEVDLKRREYVYLNNEGKQYLRLFLDQPKTHLPGKTQARKLPNNIVIEPIRGYEQEAMPLVNKLVKQFELKVQKSSLLPDCLTVLKIEPVLKGKKPKFYLDNKESGDQALKRIFLFLLDTMCENENGLMSQKDPEFLHDYRIAIRRSRSLLGQVKQPMPQDELKSVEDEFAWLSSLTGPARDHDVMLLELPEYKALLPTYDNQAFASLESYLREQQQNTYQMLVEAFHSQRYTRFKQSWRELLENGDSRIWGVERKYTIGKFATTRIGKAYKRVLSDGMSIGPDSAIEAYHKLRKSCKKLRYLMEMFRELYPQKKIKALIKELKKLQDDLGELQDLEVHTEILQSFLLQGITAKEENQQAENMVGELIERNQIRKQVIINRFVDIFDSFSNKKNKKMFTDLLGMKQL
jgi:CHAD domain-containing protein